MNEDGKGCPAASARRDRRPTVRAGGRLVNRTRVQRLMRRMGIAALGPKPKTSTPAPGHKAFPYLLLRALTIDRPNQGWAADITSVPSGRGLLSLVAIIDWASRAILSWRLSNTMDAAFCASALEDALARFGTPEIFNSERKRATGSSAGASQGSQFTSAAFTGTLTAAGVRMSMDGRGRYLDTIFMERLWRSLKSELVRHQRYATRDDAKWDLFGYMEGYYNRQRLHSALGYTTPEQAGRQAA
ncbi:MAG TPA: IS3 family transposase [Azospirillaceae bacterium]|nr:IS3 family transposase [Azospirillaceae bacterium]